MTGEKPLRPTWCSMAAGTSTLVAETAAGRWRRSAAAAARCFPGQRGARLYIAGPPRDLVARRHRGQPWRHAARRHGGRPHRQGGGRCVGRHGAGPGPDERGTWASTPGRTVQLDVPRLKSLEALSGLACMARRQAGGGAAASSGTVGAP
ncbi:hypothetical protein ACTMU2_38780 [Cupriavidus basilensis]